MTPYSDGNKKRSKAMKSSISRHEYVFGFVNDAQCTDAS